MANLEGWEPGANLDYMRELCSYWVDEFDWRAEEAAINQFSHFLTPVDGINVHFLHEIGSGSTGDEAANLELRDDG